MDSQIVAGADFSGARDVPNQTWLAVGHLDGLGLTLTALEQTGAHRLAADLSRLAGLRAVGLDFPFSLPADFMRFWSEKKGASQFQSWQEVVEHFVFASVDDLAAAVKELGKEPKRLTDNDYKGLAQSPLHRGNPSMVQMTLAGMKLLAGLDPSRFAVLPFAEPSASQCAVLEVFPRALLHLAGLPDTGYKNKEKKEQERVHAQRKQMIEKLVNLREKGGAAFREFPRLNLDKKLQHLAVESADALDAILCCYSAAIWLSAPALFRDPLDCDSEDVLLEGWIYAPAKVGQAQG